MNPYIGGGCLHSLNDTHIVGLIVFITLLNFNTQLHIISLSYHVHVHRAVGRCLRSLNDTNIMASIIFKVFVKCQHLFTSNQPLFSEHIHTKAVVGMFALFE